MGKVFILKSLVLTLILLSMLISCKNDVKEPVKNEQTEKLTMNAAIDENTEKPAETKAVIDENSGITSTYAKTAAHLFIAHNEAAVRNVDGEEIRSDINELYRLPLNNISKGKKVNIPGAGEIEIVGKSDKNLFISRKIGDNYHKLYYNIYRISLESLQYELIDSGEYLSVPRYHFASNSLLFTYSNFDNKQELFEAQVWIEAFNIDTKVRNTIYKFTSTNFHSGGSGWWQTENDSVVFINSSWGGAEAMSDFILIDSKLATERIQLDEIDGTNMKQPVPQNEGEKYIFDLKGLYPNDYTTANNWVYYLLTEEQDNENRTNLYKIKPDGTHNMLIQKNTPISSLLGVGNNLYAIVFTGNSDGDLNHYNVVKLSQNGKTDKALGSGEAGHNTGFGMCRLEGTEMIMLMGANFFKVDSTVRGIYNPVNDELFNLCPFDYFK